VQNAPFSDPVTNGKMGRFWTKMTYSGCVFQELAITFQNDPELEPVTLAVFLGVRQLLISLRYGLEKKNPNQ